MLRILAAAVIYFIIFCLIQTQFFKRTSKPILHMIPLFFAAFVYICTTVMCVGNFHVIFAKLAAIVNTVGLLGIGMAWLIEKV